MTRSVILIAFIMAATARASEIASSPDGSFGVRLVTLGYDQYRGTRQRVEIVDHTTHKVLYSWKSFHRFTEPVWNAGGRFLVVNDRIATDGDFLYVFRTANHRVKCIRKPEDGSFQKEVAQFHPELVEYERGSIAGYLWKDAQTLEVHFWGDAAPSKAAADALHYSAYRFAFDVVLSADGSYCLTNHRNLPIE